MLRSSLSNGLFNTPLNAYIHDHHGGIPADNGVVHHQHGQSLQGILLSSPLQAYMNGVVLDLDALLADLLGRHDEGSRNVPVLGQALDVPLAQRCGDLVSNRQQPYGDGGVAGSVGDGHHHVNHVFEGLQLLTVIGIPAGDYVHAVLQRQHAQLVNALSQAHAHLHTGLVDGDVVDHAVWARQVDVLKHAGGQAAGQGVHAGVQLHVQIDEQHFARS